MSQLLGIRAQTGLWTDRSVRLVVPSPSGGGVGIFGLTIQTP